MTASLPALMVTGLLVAGSWLLLCSPRRTRIAAPGPAAESGRPRRRRWRRWRRTGPVGMTDLWLMPQLVRQLAALLEAGRSPQTIWTEAARAHVTGHPQPFPDGAESARGEVLEVLQAADRAAALGHSVADTLRQHGQDAVSQAAKNRSAPMATGRVWCDLAACWEVAEQSGAPLSALLTRYAAQLEAEMDADAARQSALAGPRATATVLGWLPVLGLGLGLLMGVDPLSVLLGTPAGMAALLSGVVLMVAGRGWSSKLVAAAGRSP